MAVNHYTATLKGSPAERFLFERHIWSTAQTDFHLGYVAEPAFPIHRRYRGWMSIPILTGDLQFAGMRFRRLEGTGEKYLSMKGSASRLFAVHYADSDTVYLTEGELDAVVLHQIGLKAVGVPGSKAWNEQTGPVWRWLFRHCSKVVIIYDNDEAGNKGAVRASRDLREIVRGEVVRVKPPEKDMDVNKWLLQLHDPKMPWLTHGRLRNAIADGEE